MQMVVRQTRPIGGAGEAAKDARDDKDDEIDDAVDEDDEGKEGCDDEVEGVADAAMRMVVDDENEDDDGAEMDDRRRFPRTSRSGRRGPASFPANCFVGNPHQREKVEPTKNWRDDGERS